MADALMSGLGAIFRPRLLLIYWLLSVVLALGVTLAYQAEVQRTTSSLPDPGGLAAEGPAPFWDDATAAMGPALRVVGHGASAVTWAWLLATTLLAGGLVRAFEKRAAENRKREGRIWTLRTFLGDAGQFALRMLRLLLVTLVLAHAADWLFNGQLKEWHDRYLVAIESERFSVLTDWLREGLFVLVIFLIAVWTDLARVQVVVEQRSSVIGGRGSYSEALYNRHAFTYQRDVDGIDRFTIPAQVYASDGSWEYLGSALYLFEILDKDTPALAAMNRVGAIEPPSPLAMSSASDKPPDGRAPRYLRDQSIRGAILRSGLAAPYLRRKWRDITKTHQRYLLLYTKYINNSPKYKTLTHRSRHRPKR